jgi:hypothetical protein
VGQSLLTASRSVGRPAALNRSVRYAIAMPPTSVGMPMIWPLFAELCAMTQSR